MHLRSLVVLCAVVGVATACQDSSKKSNGSDHPRPDLSVATDQSKTQTSPTTESRVLLRGFESTPWRLVRRSGSTLTLRVYDGGCSTFKDVVSAEDRAQVVIAARSTLSKEDKCIGNLASHEEELRLTEPLGGRELVHVPVATEWRNVP